MPALPKEHVAPMLAGGASARMADEVAAGFKPGDKVRAKMMSPETHTRLPQYARGKEGVVERDHGVFCFNDTNAHGLGHKPQHLYLVRFSALHLWGPPANPKDSLTLDMFEDYLEPA